MTKLPYMQFFVDDWLSDQALSLCIPATRGVWMDLLCAMHKAGRSGELRGTNEQLARIARCSTADLALALTDLQATGAAAISERNGVVTIVNRRMKTEADKRKADNERQMRHRSKARGDPVTELSRDCSAPYVRRHNSESKRASDVDVKDPNGHDARTSTHDVDAQICLEDWEIQGAIEQCNRIIKIVPLSKASEQNRNDRSLIFKAVVLSRTVMSEDWLSDSLEAVKKHPDVSNKARYFHGVLRSKCDAVNQNFNQLLKRVQVPEQILRSKSKA